MFAIVTNYARHLLSTIKNAWRATAGEAPATLTCGAGVLLGDFIFSDDEPL